MAKVFGVQVIELRPGVKAKDFEEFVIEELYPNTKEGADLYLAKCDKGERAGKYVLLLAFDSVETRNRIWGPPGGPAREWSEADRERMAKYGVFASTSHLGVYVVLGK